MPLPNLKLEDWAAVEIRARTVDSMRNIGIDFNYTETEPVGDLRFYALGGYTPLFSDGTIQTYRIPRATVCARSCVLMSRKVILERKPISTTAMPCLC